MISKSADKKGLQILLFFQDTEIGTADYIKVSSRGSNLFEIGFDGLQLYKDVSFKKGDVIHLKIVCRRMLYNEFDAALSENPERGNQFSDCFQCSISFYDQDVINLLWDWAHDRSVLWTVLSEKEKRTWLLACLFWSGIATSLPSMESFELDCSIVKTPSDLFCLLGEVFFGPKGYLGQDLDGLNDCLAGIETETSTTNVIFKDFSKLEADLNTKDYAQQIASIFESHGFKVLIK